MKSEEIKKFTTEATDQLIAALNEGRSEAAYAVSRGDGPVPPIQSRKHHAHRISEAGRDASGRLSYLE
jgi:hypothetical protein